MIAGRYSYIAFESKIATDQLMRGLTFALIMSALVCCGLWFYFRHVGNQKILARKIRGQEAARATELVVQIEGCPAERNRKPS